MKMKVSRGQRLLFTGVTLLYWISMYIYVPILTPYLSDRGYSIAFIGIVLGSYGFMQLAVRFPLGIWSDALRKRKLFILLGMMAACLSCLLFLLPGLWIWPLAGRLMAGLCASTWVAFTVMYAGYFEPHDTSRAMGNISVMTVSGQMIGMLFSGWLSEQLAPAAPFWAGAFVAGMGLLLALSLKESEETALQRSGMSLAEAGDVVRTPLLLRVSTLSILGHGVLFITMFGFTPLKADQLGASGFQLTWLVFAFMLPHAAASYLTATWFVPRLGNWGTIGLGFAIGGLCTASLAIVQSLEWLYATQAMNGFAQGLYLPLLLGLAIRDVQPHQRATAMGLYQAIYAIGMFSGPFMAGYLNENWGLSGGFLFGAILAGAALLLVWRWASPRKSRRTADNRSDAMMEEGR
ncbi:MFS transporter [Paenibacillus chungangensis]|uniref:MFS transporter n=1 Tax=Paenibacillus chungangensis TaxID=696535 RepID=A0ABW3HPU6_9BACL